MQNEGNLKDHNKKIIKYIRSQGSKELLANEYLDLSFYELFGDFKENYLPKYLDEIEALFPKDIEKEKIDAYKNIIKIICENYLDYFDLIDERKKLWNLKMKKSWSTLKSELNSDITISSDEFEDVWIDESNIKFSSNWKTTKESKMTIDEKAIVGKKETMDAEKYMETLEDIIDEIN